MTTTASSQAIRAERSLSVTKPLFTLALGLTLIAGSAEGANRWIGVGTTDLWTDTGNWSEGTPPPNATSNPANGWDDPSGIFYPLTPDPSDDFPLFVNEAQLTEEGTTTLIDATVTSAATYSLYVGFDGASNTFEMTGGALDVGNWHLNVGRGFNRTLNPNPIATMRMSGGVINTGIVKVPEQFVDGSLDEPYDSAPLHGEFYMSGGVLNARKMNVGQFTGSGEAWFSGDAVVNLSPNVPGDPSNGGFLELKQDWFIDGLPVPTTADASIDIRGKAIFNIMGHSDMFIVSPDQSEVDRYQGYVDAHELTAWGGTAAPVITLSTDGPGAMITIEAPTVPGDANSDGVVDLLDLDILGSNFGTGEAVFGDGDFNDDGTVDLLDLDLLGANFGVTAGELFPLPPLASATVPEPACWALFCLSALSRPASHRRGTK